MKDLKRRKTYSREFKMDVIHQSYVRGNIGTLANELGIPAGTMPQRKASLKQ